MIQEAWPIGYPTCQRYQFSCSALSEPLGRQHQLHTDEKFRTTGFFKLVKHQIVVLLISVVNHWMNLVDRTKLMQNIRLCSSSSSLWI
jgi:hypothetical protein